MTDDAPDGWAIAVWTERLGGERPMLVLYAAVFSDENDAMTAVNERLDAGSGDEIGKAHRLSSNTIKALGLKPGDCCML